MESGRKLPVRQATSGETALCGGEDFTAGTWRHKEIGSDGDGGQASPRTCWARDRTGSLAVSDPSLRGLQMSENEHSHGGPNEA